MTDSIPFRRVEFDMEEVHDASLDLLQFLEDGEHSHDVQVAALALSLGRLNSPKVLSPDEQSMFVEGVLQYCAMFHCDGRPN
jgi:hypothetical protein